MAPLACLWLLTSGASAMPTVNIGGMFPKFKTKAASYDLDKSGVRRLTAFVQAIAEINNKSDGIADHLLPNTTLRIATADSKRDPHIAFLGARNLAQDAFGGLGVSAVIGAASSSPSLLAAFALEPTRTPQISYSSTSPTLSDGGSHPYFLRTPPSDAFQARGLADLAKNLFEYSRTAAVWSSDAYGVGGIEVFLDEAAKLDMNVLVKLQFTVNEPSFEDYYEQLRNSGARVILLFCGTSDASRFIEGAYEAGIGGDGYLWLGSDAVANPATMEAIVNVSRRDAIYRGLFGLTPSSGEGTASYEAYVARMRAMRDTSGNGTHCDLEVDDGGTYLWAQDHDDNVSTPLACAGSDNQDNSTDPYSPYTYDATFALAHALHELIEVRNVSAIDGDELMEVLTRDVSFAGVTGLVEFHDASDHPTKLYHGDRTVGVKYDLLNYVGGAQGLATVGQWTPCADCTFAERWAPSAEQFAYSTSDDSRPLDGTVIALLMQLTDAGGEDLGKNPVRMLCAALLAVQHVNAKNGSVVPELAGINPHFQMRARVEDIQTDVTSAIEGYRAVQTAAVDGIVDGASSVVNVQVAQLGALDAMPQLGFWSTSPQLSAEQYTHFGRTVVSDERTAFALATEVLKSFDWKYVGILNVRTDWSTSFADALSAFIPAAGLTVRARNSWDSGDAKGIQLAVEQTKKSGVSIIVFMVYQNDLVGLMGAADAAGLLQSEYVWIAVDAEIWTYLGDTNATLAAQLTGMLSFQTTAAVSNGFSRFKRAWASMRAADCAQGGEHAPLDNAFFSEPPDNYAAFAYDAVAALGLGLQNATDPHDGGAVLRALKAPAFSLRGASGGIEFDAQLDRRHQLFSLTSLVHNGSVQQQIVRIVQLSNFSDRDGAFEDAPLVWRDGSTNVPADLLASSEAEQANQTGTLELRIGRSLRDFIIISSAVLLSALVLISMAAYVRGRSLWRKEFARQKVHEAIRGLARLEYPFVFVSAAEFVALGKLHTHEHLRDAGKLQFADHPKDVHDRNVVFFSHQWTAWSEPDPDVLQYPVMVAALSHVIEKNRWLVDDVVVWVDLCSIPQALRTTQLLAIHTIANYCATADAFVICAPATTHKDTLQACDEASYQLRMWCRCEQLCHMLRKGTAQMWLATAVGQCAPLGSGRAFAQELSLAQGQGSRNRVGVVWLKHVLRVFEGDVTTEADKLSIVMPILGLYAELYARVKYEFRTGTQSTRQSSAPPTRPHRQNSPVMNLAGQVRNLARQSSEAMNLSSKVMNLARRSGEPEGLTNASDLMTESSRPTERTLRAMLREIQSNRHAIFPTHMRQPMATARQLLAALPLVGPLFERRTELFGGLISEVEQMIDEEPRLLEYIRNNELAALRENIKGVGRAGFLNAKSSLLRTVPTIMLRSRRPSLGSSSQGTPAQPDRSSHGSRRTSLSSRRSSLGLSAPVALPVAREPAPASAAVCGLDTDAHRAVASVM